MYFDSKVKTWIRTHLHVVLKTLHQACLVLGENWGIIFYIVFNITFPLTQSVINKLLEIIIEKLIPNSQYGFQTPHRQIAKLLMCSRKEPIETFAISLYTSVEAIC